MAAAKRSTGNTVDRLWAKIEREKAPCLTASAVEAIEQFAQNSGVARRIALAYLGRVWNETAHEIESNRDSAVAMARASDDIAFTAAKYRELADLMDTASTRIKVALCARSDMDAVLSEAKARANEEVTHG